MTRVRVVGAGLAGSEAAMTLASLGHSVELIDIKPQSMTAAHTDKNFGELVCSNSLKSNLPTTASGLQKQELRLLGSRLIAIADKTSVDAGGALAVDRLLFSEAVTRSLCEEKNIQTVCCEYTKIDPTIPTIIATGPLTSAGLSEALAALVGSKSLYFFDASAPIVDAESIDYGRTFAAGRYGKGGDDYINCPLGKDEYLDFVKALVGAERVKLKDFEGTEVFEGCMPVEVLAARGADSLRYGPLKPVGLYNADGLRPYAVLQLRSENALKTSFNLVGCQTNLTFAEQRRVFGLIPALKNAEYLRYGIMHRNTYLNAPAVMTAEQSLKAVPNIFIAGQLSGVEGYVESIASGLTAAIHLHRRLAGLTPSMLSQTTMTGALQRATLMPAKNFQPVNANFGIVPPLETTVRDKRQKYAAFAERALADVDKYVKSGLCQKST